MNQIFKAVLFDLDGVLVDMCEGHKIALNRALREVSHITIPNDRHYTEFNGLPTKVKLEKLIREGSIDPDDAPEIQRRKQIYTVESIINTVHPSPRLRALLDLIENEYCVPIGCVTNSIRSTTLEALNAGEIWKTNGDMLDVIVTNEDVKRNKPHPDCYLFAAAQLRLAPKDIIAVEDSDYGVQAATDAGVRVWRVKNVNDVTAENFERYLDNL